MYNYNSLEHPEIKCIRETGYPSWNQPKSYYCNECGTCLDDETIYEDNSHEFLCEKCLLSLYEKVW